MKAIVIGRNYVSLLSMARCAGMAGCEVIIIRTVREIHSKSLKKRIKRALRGGDIESASRFVTNHSYAIEPNRESLINTINSFYCKDETVILLPTDDFAASTIDLYLDELSPRFLCPSINGVQGEVVRLMDKNLQKELLKKWNIPVADSWSVNIMNGEYTLPEGIEYPVFTKPQVSFSGSKTYMKKCENESQLRNVLNEIATKSDVVILVEKYFVIEKEYGVLGVCNGDEVVIPGIVEKEKIGSGNHKGVTMIGRYCPFEKDDSIKDNLTDFLKSIHFNGLVDVDLYESDGIVYFNELNMRLGAFGFASMCAGINLVQLYIDRICGRRTEFTISFNNPIRCINEKVNIDDYAAGYISYSEYRDNRAKCEYGFVEYQEDLRPYRRFRNNEILTRVSKKIHDLGR